MYSLCDVFSKYHCQVTSFHIAIILQWLLIYIELCLMVKKKQLRTTARESFQFQSSAKKLKSRTICANVYTCILYPKYAVTNSSIASIETLRTNSFLKILCIYHFYSDPIQNLTPSLTFLDTTRSFYWNGLFIQCSYIYLKSIANLSSVLLVNLVWCNYKKESSRFITSRHIIWRLDKLSIKHGLTIFYAPVDLF